MPCSPVCPAQLRGGFAPRRKGTGERQVHVMWVQNVDLAYVASSISDRGDDFFETNIPRSAWCVACERPSR